MGEFLMFDTSRYGRSNSPVPGVSAGPASDQNGPWNIASAQYHAAYQGYLKAVKAAAAPKAVTPKSAAPKSGTGKASPAAPKASAPKAVGAGPAAGHVVMSPGAAMSAGPGNKAVTTGKLVSTGKGPGKVGVAVPAPNAAALIPDDVPLERIGIGGHQESLGAISDIGWSKTATGWVPVPSGDVKERIEDNLFMEASWFLRNYLTPMFVGGYEVPPDFLDPAYSTYVPILNEWQSGINPRPDKDGNWIKTGGGF